MSGKRFEKNKSEIRKLGGGAVKKTKKRRRSNAGRIALVVTVLSVALVGIILSLTVFFKTKEIDVYGESRYSSKDIVAAGKIELESNLIRLDSKKIAGRIETALPYIEKVELVKKLPTTAVLKVTEAKVAGYVKTDEGYSILSTNGKVLEKVDKLPEKMAEILGIDANGVKVSELISDESGALSSARAIFNSEISFCWRTINLSTSLQSLPISLSLLKLIL